MTFVTDRQPEKRPKGSIGDKRQNDDYTEIFKGRFNYYYAQFFSKTFPTVSFHNTEEMTFVKDDKKER